MSREASNVRASVIIAGGRSTRFGDQDKAVASLAGRPMIRRVVDRVAQQVDAIVVNCRRDQDDRIRDALSDPPIPISYAYDETPDLGPVGGMAHGLRTVTANLDATYAFVAACDMPFIDPAIVDYLFEQTDRNDAVVPRLDDGWYQPTHAVYHAERMAAACERAIKADRLRVLDPLDELDVRTVSQSDIEAVGDLASFENVNTREELQDAAERLTTADTD